ncbi:uncharacterized protein [Fopius arisanus]|uniref:RPC_3085 protein n=1 Tax=Fopius arisanus TaxID=64838 RepID=A0A0C9RPY3_9HYME|nr:PREDICTED: uncharacterized protein LOC105270391 [Fopius arisanus]
MENDTWAQTLFTITPEEDGYLREITDETVISAPEDLPLVLDTENIAYRETLVKITRDFVDPRELEKTEFQESECQTYMKGIPKVEYVISHQDEASQTLFIGRNCPPPPGQTARPVVDILNKKVLPKLKKSQLVQTIITVLEDLPQTAFLEGLLQKITDEEQNDPELMVNATETELTKIETLDLLNFLLDRTIWIADTTPDVLVQTRDILVETKIKYNERLTGFMIDFEGQTNLSLQPAKSTSKLLDDYLKVKHFVEDVLEGVMDSGVHDRIFVDDFVDEIIDRCSEFVRLPLKDEAIQTLASGRPFDAKDDEILETLRRSVIADPVQTTEMVLPIVSHILDRVSEIVAVDSRAAAQFVVDKVVHKANAIGKKLYDIKNAGRGPPIDEIFALRRRKLMVSMPKKREMEDASTQTGLAGVPQIRKFQENKEVVCCVCPTNSKCRWCSEENTPPKDMRPFRTQDILLAYKPCYVVMDPGDATPDMKRPCAQDPPVQIAFSDHETSTELLNSSERCSCMIQTEGKLDVAESTSGWSHVIATDAWLLPSTPSHQSKSTMSVKISESNCKSTRSQIPIPKTTMEALQVLKSTFCNRETCPGVSSIEDPNRMPQEIVPGTSRKNQNVVCTNYPPPDSDECICDYFNDQIQNKLKILEIQLQIKSKKPER